MRARNRDAVADVEEGVVVSAGEILLQYEFFARRQKEGAFIAIIGEVLITNHGAKTIEPLAEVFWVFPPLRHAPSNELLSIVHRRRHVEREGRRHVRHRQPRRKRACNQAGGAGDKLTSLHQWPPQPAPAGSNPGWPDILNGGKTRHPCARFRRGLHVINGAVSGPRVSSLCEGTARPFFEGLRMMDWREPKRRSRAPLAARYIAEGRSANADFPPLPTP